MTFLFDLINLNILERYTTYFFAHHPPFASGSDVTLEIIVAYRFHRIELLATFTAGPPPGCEIHRTVKPHLPHVHLSRPYT